MRTHTSPGRRGSSTAPTTLGALVIAASLVLAACGSSGKSSTATTAPTTTTGGSSTTTGSSSSSAIPAAVIARVKKYSAPPAIDLAPLSHKPATGKFVIYLASSAVPQDIQQGQGFKTGAAALGWKSQVITYNGTPASFVTALQQAISDKPNAISFSGQEPAEFTSQLQAADKAGIAVIPAGDITKPTGIANGGLAASIGGPITYKAYGQLTADWIIVNSHGKANVAILNFPSFPSVQLATNESAKELATECPDCKSKIINLQVTDIGTNAPGDVVSAIQADPSINYVLVPFGSASTGLDAAMGAAGLKSVKIVVNAAVSENLQALRNGTEAMGANLSPQVASWGFVDAIARYFDNPAAAPFTEDPILERIYTPATVPAAGDPPSPSNYQQEFLKIWQAG